MGRQKRVRTIRDCYFRGWLHSGYGPALKRLYVRAGPDGSGVWFRDQPLAPAVLVAVIFSPLFFKVEQGNTVKQKRMKTHPFLLARRVAGAVLELLILKRFLR